MQLLLVTAPGMQNFFHRSDDFGCKNELHAMHTSVETLLAMHASYQCITLPPDAVAAAEISRVTATKECCNYYIVMSVYLYYMSVPSQ